jgi:hypothetical protein
LTNFYIAVKNTTLFEEGQTRRKKKVKENIEIGTTEKVLTISMDNFKRGLDCYARASAKTG